MINEQLSLTNIKKKEQNDLPENYFSFKKHSIKRFLVGITLIFLSLFAFFLLYYFYNTVIFDKFLKKSLFNDSDSFFSFRLTNLVFGLALLLILIGIAVAIFYCLIKGTLLLFEKEMVVLAKITRISNTKTNEEENLVDYPNASLSKALAKVFKQVTIQQKAASGKITNINIFASQTKNFNYPKPKSVFHQLAGICKTMGIEIELFSQEDFKKFLSDLSTNFGNPISYQLKGLGLIGEPANQHIQKFTNPVDKLVETIVNYSKDVELHTFSTIRQGSALRYWFKKRTLTRTKSKDGSERNLSPKQLHKITETNDMAKFGYVNGEVAVLIKGLNGNLVEEIQDKMIGNLGTVYDGITRNVQIKKINPMKILKSVKNHELITNKHQLISAYSARAIINVYRKPISGIPFIKDIMNPPSERRLQETHPIMLGETGSGEEIRTNLQDHEHHCGIFGTTGYGKSEWIQAEVEQILKHYPDKRIMIFDFDGEYARAFLNHPGFLVLEANNPDAPLHINPFEGEGSDLVQHADSLFSYFNEILSLDQKYGEFTPPQKDILWEGIIATVEQDDSSAKNYAVFNQKVREYIEANKYEFVRGDMSAKSLLLKLKFYQRELRNIIMCNQSNFTMDMLENTNVIFNLKSILSKVGKRAITTLLLYHLRNYALKKGSRELWLKVYIEEAVVVTPKADKKDQMLFVEECLTVIRKLGVSFTLIGTTAEKVTDFIMDSPYLVNIHSISSDFAKKMNTKMELQHSLKKFQLDIKLPNEEYPIRLIKLTRPKRKKLSEEEYIFFLKTSPKYEHLRSTSYLLDDNEFQESSQSLMNKCLENCSFNFYNLKDCFLRKKYKIMQLLEDSLREFIEEHDGLEGVKALFENDLSDTIDRITIVVTTSIVDDAKYGHKTITREDKEHLTKCAFTWLLKELTYNNILTNNQALGHLLEYEITLESLQSSKAIFDDFETDYQFDTGDYNDDWEYA